MEFFVERQDIWIASLRDKPGALAEKLLCLKDAGADFDFIIARRSTDRPGAGVVFVTPLRSDREIAAASEAGFNVSRSLYALRVEGPNRPGIAAEITARVASEGISLNGFSAATSGPKLIVNLAVDSRAERERVTTILEEWAEPAVAEPAREEMEPVRA